MILPTDPLPSMAAPVPATPARAVAQLAAVLERFATTQRDAWDRVRVNPFLPAADVAAAAAALHASAELRTVAFAVRCAMERAT